MRRMLCFILSVCLIACGITPVFANDNASYTFFSAYDDIDYPADDMLANHGSDYNSATAWNGGEGFNGGWYPSAGSPASYMPTIRNANGKKWIRNYLSAVGVGRKLSQNITTDSNGEYYLSFDIYDTGTTDLSGVNDRVGFGISSDASGGPYIYCGLTYFSSSSLCLKLGVGDDFVKAEQGYSLSGIDGSNANEILSMKLKIKVNAEGNDCVYAKVWKINDVEPTEWTLSLNCELSGKNFDMIDTRNTGTSLQVGNIKVEGIYDNGDSGVLGIFDKLKDSQDITETEAKRGIDFARSIAKKSEIILDEFYTKLLSPYITANGMEEIRAVTATSSEVSGAVVHAEEAKDISVNISDAIDIENSSVVFKDGASQTVDAEITIEDKMIKICSANNLSPLTDYTIDLSQVKDSLGIYATPAIISFTTSAIPIVNIKDGGEHSEGVRVLWEDVDGVAVTAVLDGNSIEKNHQILETGEHTLVIYATHNGTEVSRSIDFSITESYEPEASDVKITGTAETGAMLTGSYVFSDRNNDLQGESIFKWYRCDVVDGEYTLIEGANGSTYTLTEDDENCYVKFEVTPVSDSLYAHTGAAVRSEAFTGAFAPEISKADISGKILLGETLTIKTEANDLNGDGITGKIYKWYTSDSADGEFTAIEGADGDTLTVTEEHFQKFVRAGIVPVSAKAPFNGNEVFTDVIIMPAKPVVTDVEINGTALVGHSISAEYVFTDINNDEENGSVISWINPVTGKVLGTGPVLKITADMAGMTVALKIVGMSSNEPKSSAEAVSASIVIGGGSGVAGGIVSGGIGSGSGGGSMLAGGAGSSSYVPPVTQDTENSGNKEDDKKPLDNDEGKTPAGKFSDIKGHWAEEYIASLAESGMINGVSENSYEPERSITRGEYIAMMMRAANPEKVDYVQVYNDVSEDMWFAEAVMWAYSEGVIAKDEYFRPNDEITREEAAKMLTFATKEAQIEEISCSDASNISEWALEYVMKAYASGLMKGDENGNFRPMEFITRAEVAVILYRIITE